MIILKFSNLISKLAVACYCDEDGCSTDKCNCDEDGCITDNPCCDDLCGCDEEDEVIDGGVLKN